MERSTPGVHGTVPSLAGIPRRRNTPGQHHDGTLTDGSSPQVI